jgi:signal transduction histidine kinase
VTGSQTWTRWPRAPQLALSITSAGLTTCVVAFLASSHEHLFEPLTLLLAACALVANLAYIGLDERILVDASFVPSILAIAFLGPAAAFAIVVIGEVGSWCLRPYRVVAMPINTLARGAPALVAAASFQSLGPSGFGFYLILGALGFAALVLNDLILTPLIGLLDNAPVLERLRDHVKLLPAISINVLLALATVSLYRNAGLGAIALVLLAILVFNYMVTQMLGARRQAKRVAELAASRQRLVVEALNAEERERRNLSDMLHDEPIQDVLLARQELVAARSGDASGFRRADLAMDRALQQLRSVVFDLHPSVLEQAGLAPALEAVAERQSHLGKVAITVSIDPSVTGCKDRFLFTLSKELLTNVARHSKATHAALHIGVEDGRIVVDVRDDGVGLTWERRVEAVREGHIGLASILERVQSLGGRVDVNGAPNDGAHVRIILPRHTGEERDS